ncbi:MAG: hypothetical protein ROW39_07405 [Anaerolineaceae bacterium]|jgi:tetratricopeptide (TPR) repeat protein
MVKSTQQTDTIDKEARNRPLSAVLDQIEARLGKIAAGSSDQGLPVLVDLDEVYHRLNQYRGDPDSIKAETTQFDYVQATIRANMGLLLSQVGGPARLQAMRTQLKPEAARWWYYLDELVAQRQRGLMQRAGVTAVMIVVVVALLGVIYQAFLAPDAQTVARLRHQRDAETALMQGDIETALSEINRALGYDPENLELLVMQAIAQQLTGHEETAAASFAQLATRFATQEEFLVQRALYYNQFGRPDLALADAEAVLAINPNSPAGHFYAAMAYEKLERFNEALELYEIAYTLAIEQDQTALAVTIRMNMGMLLQALPALVTPEQQTQPPADN